MAGATILPVPKAVDIEAHHYPRRWKRNLFFRFQFYSVVLVVGFNLFALVEGFQSYKKSNQKFIF